MFFGLSGEWEGAEERENPLEAEWGILKVGNNKICVLHAAVDDGVFWSVGFTCAEMGAPIKMI